MLSRDPGELKILSMTNYKTLVRCKGYSSRGSGLGLGASDGQQADSRWNCFVFFDASNDLWSFSQGGGWSAN